MTILKISTFLTLLALSQSSHAGFTIAVKDYDESQVPSAARAAYRAQLDDVVADLQTKVNTQLEKFPTNFDKFMDGTADAMSLANAGTNFDYISNFKYALVGASAGVTFNQGDASLKKLINGTDQEKKDEAKKIRGAGASGSLLFGMPLSVFATGQLGFIDLARVKLFSNFFFLDLPKSGPFDSKVSSFGVGAQYKLFPGSQKLGGIVGWGGLDISSGLKYSRVNMSVSHTVKEGDAEVTLDNPPGATVSYTGDVSLAVASSAVQIPIEASTSAKLLYILDLFAGVGTDITIGSTTSRSNAPGTVTPKNLSAGGQTVNPTFATTFSIGDSTGHPRPISARYFVGLALDVYVANLSVQVNQDITGKPLGVNVGLRAFW